MNEIDAARDFSKVSLAGLKPEDIFLGQFLYEAIYDRCEELGLTTAAENGRIGRGGRAQKIVYAAERKEANPTRRKQMNALAEAMYKTWICRHVDAARLLYTAGVRNPVVAASRSEAHNHGNPKPIKMLALLTEPIGLTPEQYDMAQKLMVQSDVRWDRIIETAQLLTAAE